MALQLVDDPHLFLLWPSGVECKINFGKSTSQSLRCSNNEGSKYLLRHVLACA